MDINLNIEASKGDEHAKKLGNSEGKAKKRVHLFDKDKGVDGKINRFAIAGEKCKAEDSKLAFLDKFDPFNQYVFVTVEHKVLKALPAEDALNIVLDDDDSIPVVKEIFKLNINSLEKRLGISHDELIKAREDNAPNDALVALIQNKLNASIENEITENSDTLFNKIDKSSFYSDDDSVPNLNSTKFLKELVLFSESFPEYMENKILTKLVEKIVEKSTDNPATLEKFTTVYTNLLEMSSQEEENINYYKLHNSLFIVINSFESNSNEISELKKWVNEYEANIKQKDDQEKLDQLSKVEIFHSHLSEGKILHNPDFIENPEMSSINVRKENITAIPFGTISNEEWVDFLKSRCGINPSIPSSALQSKDTLTAFQVLETIASRLIEDRLSLTSFTERDNIIRLDSRFKDLFRITIPDLDPRARANLLITLMHNLIEPLQKSFESQHLDQSENNLIALSNIVKKNLEIFENLIYETVPNEKESIQKDIFEKIKTQHKISLNQAAFALKYGGEDPEFLTTMLNRFKPKEYVGALFITFVPNPQEMLEKMTKLDLAVSSQITPYLKSKGSGSNTDEEDDDLYNLLL